MHGWCGGECGCQQFVMSAVWAASELTQPQPTHIHTTYTPTSASTYDQEEVKSKERERDMFPSARQMVLLDNLMMLIWENPHSSPRTHICTHSHARMRTCTRTHSYKHAHTQSCKYMWRQQSPAEVQVWTTSATGPATHTCTDTVILPWVQTKPGLVFHHQTHI